MIIRSKNVTGVIMFLLESVVLPQALARAKNHY